MTNKRKETIFTLIGFVTVLGIVVLYNVLLKGDQLLTPYKQLYVRYNNLKQLEESAPVLYQGVQAGKVTGIRYHTDSAAYFVLELRIDDRIRIPRSSETAIVNDGITGGKAIEIFAAPDVGRYVENGDTLYSGTALTLEDNLRKLIDPVVKRGENIVRASDSMFRAIEGAAADNLGRQGYVRTIMDSLAHTFEGLKLVKNRVDTWTTRNRSERRAIMTNIKRMSTFANRTSKLVDEAVEHGRAVKADSATVNNLEGIQRSIANLRQSFDALGKAAERHDNTTGKLLNDTVLQTEIKTLGDTVFLKDYE